MSLGRDLMEDLCHALRILGNSPRFTFVAILTLALGIGANTAIFSVVDADLLRPVPYKQPERIVQILSTSEKLSLKMGRASAVALSAPEFLRVKSQGGIFQEVAAYENRMATLTGRGEPEELHGAAVSAELFPLLRVNPIVGGMFPPDAEQPGFGQVVLLGHALWQQRFSSDKKVLGQVIALDGKPYTVLGVLPEGFRFPQGATDFWIPFIIEPGERVEHGLHGIRAIARLRSGVSLTQAQNGLNFVASSLAERFPVTDRGWRLRVVHFRQIPPADLARSLVILWAAVSFVLFIACINIALLLLARTAIRRKEIAIRMALGASRARIFGQLLTENLLLAAIGGVIGLLVAYWSVGLARLSMPQQARDLNVAHLDFSTLLFTFAISILSVIVFGPVAAFQALDSDLNQSLKENGAESAPDSHIWHKIRRALVASQVALAMVLLTGSGLLIRSFVHLISINPGFDTHNLLSLELSLPESKYPSNGLSRSMFVKEIIDRIKALPGVTNVAVSSSTFFGDLDNLSVTIPESSLQGGISAGVRFLTPGMFEELQIPFLEGRDFSRRDNLDSSCVVIVNESLARSGWPNEEVLGRMVNSGFRMPSPTCTIIGVVADTRDLEMSRPPGPEIYFPYWQLPQSDFYVLVRTTRSPRSIADPVRRQVRAVDQDQPIDSIMTMNDALEGSLSAQLHRTVLLSCFGLSSLSLSLIGLYGIMSYFVSRRAHEIAVRIALGAHTNDILWMVVWHGIKVMSVGIALGTAGALALTRVLSGLLFGVTAFDPATYVTVIILVLLVGLLACYIPARRAARVDPMVALRYD